MAENVGRPTIRIELTPEQQEQIEQFTGRKVRAVEVKAEEPEDRTEVEGRIAREKR